MLVLVLVLLVLALAQVLCFPSTPSLCQPMRLAGATCQIPQSSCSHGMRRANMLPQLLPMRQHHPGCCNRPSHVR